MRPPSAPRTCPDRRQLLASTSLLVAAAIAGCRRGSADATGGEPEVTPGEDLMQEHGVLERVLLVYGEAGRRIDRGEALDTSLIVGGAGIVRRFIEDYHERDEERFLFPRLEAIPAHAPLIAVLRRQHERGRAVTDDIVRLAAAGPSPALADAMRAFERMYRPHAAREDTVVFPAFRAIVGRDGYRELGERLEEEEHRAVGPHGFEEAVASVAALEAALGIGDLAAFTP